MYIKKMYKHLNCRECEGTSSQAGSLEQCLGARGELKWKLSSLVTLHGEDFQSSSPLVKFGNPQGKATTWHFLKLMMYVVK